MPDAERLSDARGSRPGLGSAPSTRRVFNKRLRSQPFCSSGGRRRKSLLTQICLKHLFFSDVVGHETWLLPWENSGRTLGTDYETLISVRQCAYKASFKWKCFNFPRQASWPRASADVRSESGGVNSCAWRDTSSMRRLKDRESRIDRALPFT